MGQQVSRRVLWPRKGNIFSSNEKKTTLKIYFKKAGCVGYHHLDEKRKEFQSNFIVNNINNNNKVAYWYTPYCISNLISRNLKEKKKKNLISIGRNTLIKITLRWIFLLEFFQRVIQRAFLPRRSAEKTAIPFENWRRKVSSASSRFETKLLTFDVLCARRLLNVAKPRVKFARVGHPARESLKRVRRTDQPCVIRVLVVARCTWKKKKKRGKKYERERD